MLSTSTPLVLMLCSKGLAGLMKHFFFFFFNIFITLPGRVLGSDEEGEEEEEDNGEEADAYLREQQAKLEQEKEAILGNQSLIAEVEIPPYII